MRIEVNVMVKVNKKEAKFVSRIESPRGEISSHKVEHVIELTKGFCVVYKITSLFSTIMEFWEFRSLKILIFTIRIQFHVQSSNFIIIKKFPN